MALDDRLSDLLVDWEQSQRDGRETTPEELCRDAPDLLPVVRESIDSLKATRWMFAPDPSEPHDVRSHDASRAAFHDTELPASHLTVEQFAASIFQSGLLSADEIAELNGRLAASDLPGEAREIASRLVTEGKLTRYQASVLLKASKDPLLVDNYVILDTLDTGGMGLVFKALHRSMNRVVALKLLPAAMMSARDTVKRFQREVQAAASLSHPNIVAAFDADESAEIAYLVLEYVEGTNLFRLVKEQGPRSVVQACNYVRQAATGLAYLHARGIIHRDVKPANLILANDGTVKLLDMGLVRFASSEDLSSVETDQELTQAGIVIGTVAYMSPEQALDTRSADQRSDIYSLGCTLFFLLTGRSLYHEETGMKTLLAHREQAVPSIREFCEEAPVSLDAVFRTMVAKRPADRLQSMTEVVAALDACVPGLATNAPAVAPRRVPTARVLRPSWTRGWHRWRSNPLRIGLAIALLASLAAGPFLAGVLIRIKTKQGTTEVHVDDPDAEVTVTHADNQAANLQGLINGRKRHAETKTSVETMAPEDPIQRKDREIAQREASIQKLQVENQQLRSQSDAWARDRIHSNDIKIQGFDATRDPFVAPPKQAGVPQRGGSPAGPPSVDRQVAQWAANFPAAFLCLEDNPTKAVQPVEAYHAEKAAIVAIFVDQKSGAPYHYEDADVERLASLPELKWLNLRGPNVTDSLVVRLKNLKGLEGLSLARARITDECLPALAEMTHLSYLDLSECSGITDAGLKQLAQLKSLNDRTLAAAEGDVKRAWLKLGGHFSPRPLPMLGLDGTVTTAAELLKLQQALPNCSIYARQILPGYEVPLPPPPGSSDRAWAEWIFRHVAQSAIYVDLDPETAIYAAKDLPPINFHIERILFGANEEVGPVLNGFLLQRLGDLAHLRVLRIDRKVVERDSGGLAAIKSLKSLALGAGSAGDETLRQVAALTGLTSLTVQGSEITDQGVKSLAALKNLTQLRLDGHAHNLNGRGFDALTGLASLKELDLSGAGIDEEGIRHIAQLAGLEELDLSETGISGKGLAELARLKHLKSLNLRFCRAMRSADLAPLVELPALEDLSLADCRINDEAADTLKKLNKLRTLNVDRTGMSSDVIRELQRTIPKTRVSPAGVQTQATPGGPRKNSAHFDNSQVRSPARPAAIVGKTENEISDRRELFGNSRTRGPKPGSSDVDWATWLLNANPQEFTCQVFVDVDPKLTITRTSDLPPINFHIQKLRFGQPGDSKGLPMTASFFERLADLTQLQTLQMYGEVPTKELRGLVALKSLHALAIHDASAGDDALGAICAMTHLEKLVFDSGAITDGGLKSLGSLKELTELSLPGCARNLHGTGFEALRDITTLRMLRVAGSGIDDDGAKQIGKLVTLEQLDLAHTWISVKGLADLAGLTNLKLLNLSRCQRLRATDMAPLAGISSLEVVSLNGCRIGDRAVDALKKLPKLKFLQLDNTDVTPAAIRMLRDTLRQARVVSPALAN